MNLDEICITCHYPRGSHKTRKLAWTNFPGSDKERLVEFWQEGLCPDTHNMMQPSWDMYLFHGPESGWPYKDLARINMDRMSRRASYSMDTYIV